MEFFKLSPAKLMLLNLLIAVSSAEGSVLVVTDSRDSTRTNSLRGAIITANARSRSQPSNTILLGGSRWPGTVSTFHLTIGGADETNAFTGDLDIVRGNLTIVGIGKNVIIDARSLGDRAFHVHKNAALWLQNISIVGAQAASGANWEADGEPGGAIYNEGTLTMVNCALLGNASGEGGYALGNDGQPSGGNGGGIYNAGKLNMARCLVSSNWCGGLAWFGGGGQGGGIWNAGAASLSYCVLDGNAASGAQTVQGMGLTGGSGGGVYNTGTLYLYNCTVRHNVSGQGAAGGLPGWSNMYTPGGSGGAAGDGGGIYSSGKVTVLRSVLSENRTGDGGDGANGPGGGGAGGAGGSGGAIYSTGALILNGCTVIGNVAANGGMAGSGMGGSGPGGDGGSGGGIYSLGNLALTNCTVSRNGTGWGGDGGNGAEGGASGGAGGSGAGIYAAGTFDSVSCTVCSNATGSGGAGGAGTGSVSIPAPGEQVVCPGGAGGDGGSGGGVFCATNIAVHAGNDLVARNIVGAGGTGGSGYILVWDDSLLTFSTTNTLAEPGSNGAGPDFSGTVLSRGFNLISEAEGSAGFTDGVGNDLLGSADAPIDPRLGPLQMNGGPTPTHALLPGSPAIDQGSSFGIPIDQRGHARPHRYPAIPKPPGGDGSDIGAFERDTAR